MKRNFSLPVALCVLLAALCSSPVAAQSRPLPPVADYCDDGIVNAKKLFYGAIGKREGDIADNWQADVMASSLVRELLVEGQMSDISRDAGMRVQWRTPGAGNVFTGLAPIVFTASRVPQTSREDNKEDGRLLHWYTVTRQFIVDDTARDGYVHGRDFRYAWHYLGGDTNAEVRVPCGATTPVPPTVPPVVVPPVVVPPVVTQPVLTESALKALELLLMGKLEAMHHGANVSFNTIDNKQDALKEQLRQHDENPGILKRVLGNRLVQMGLTGLTMAIGQRTDWFGIAGDPAPQPAP